MKKWLPPSLAVFFVGSVAVLTAWMWLSPRTSRGTISIGSPTVYTRQRLVNDRLEQASWLQKQLEVTNDKLRDFIAIDGFQSRNEKEIDTASVAAGKESAESPIDALKHSETEDKHPTLTTNTEFHLTQTTLDKFLAMKDFRDRVRVELMQTLLDDRHDIQGNTIYRLAFDTAIVSGINSEDVAFVIMQISHNADSPENNADYEELYNDWVGYADTVIQSSASGVRRIIANSYMDEDDPNAQLVRSLFPLFMSYQVCSTLAGKGDLPFLSNDVADGCNPTDTRLREINRQLNEIVAKTVKQAKQSNQKALEDYITGIKNSIDTIAQANKTKGNTYNSDDAFQLYKQVCLGMPTPPEKMSLDSEKTEKGEIVPTHFVKCLPDEKAEINPLRVWTTLYRQVETNSRDNSKLDQLKELVIDDKPEAIQRALKILLELHDGVCIIKTPDTTAAYSTTTPAAYTTDNYRCAANEFYGWFLSKWKGRRSDEDQILDFLDLTNVGNSDVGCNLSASRKELYSKNGKNEQTWTALRDRLDVQTETFVYNLEPKNLNQRLSTMATSLQLMNVAGAVRTDIASNKVDGSISTSRSRDKHLEEIQNHTLIVPIGEGRSSLVDKGEARLTFGWAIAPRIEESGPRQIDSVFPLAAVVSVPSWWRSIDIHYRTCWLDRNSLEVLLSDQGRVKITPSILKICSSENSLDQIDRIRLPAVESEVSRKLGIEFQKQPHFDFNQVTQFLYIGYKGDLVLRGGRLWRGTEIYLGNQKAQSISVLPDMSGVVAHFNCIAPLHPASGAILAPASGAILAQDNPGTEVVVVTSEGIDKQLLQNIKVVSSTEPEIVKSLEQCERKSATELAKKGTKH